MVSGRAHIRSACVKLLEGADERVPSLLCSYKTERVFCRTLQWLRSPAARAQSRLSVRPPPGTLRLCAPSPPVSAGVVAGSRTAHSVPSLRVRALSARDRVSDYSRHLGPPPFSPSLIKEQFHLSLIRLLFVPDISHPANTTLTSLVLLNFFPSLFSFLVTFSSHSCSFCVR